MINYITDNRDGTMSMYPDNLIITATNSTVISQISSPGNYSVTFNYYDIARNQLDGVNINLNITS